MVRAVSGLTVASWSSPAFQLAHRRFASTSTFQSAGGGGRWRRGSGAGSSSGGYPTPGDQGAATGVLGRMTAEVFPFEFDLDAHEVRRRAEILRALGSDWDPVAVLRGEEEAYELLYSGLDADQVEVYDRLVAAGVLAGRREAA
jgi:hypothetical protein